MDEDKPLLWIGSCLDDISAFPDEVKLVMGYALRTAQKGLKSPRAKPLAGFGGAGVLEVVDDHDGDTYRAVYTVKFEGVVYGLHAFQKKSTKGSKTRGADLKTIRQRLKTAAADHAKRTETGKKDG